MDHKICKTVNLDPKVRKSVFVCCAGDLALALDECAIGDTISLTVQRGVGSAQVSPPVQQTEAVQCMPLQEVPDLGSCERLSAKSFSCGHLRCAGTTEAADTTRAGGRAQLADVIGSGEAFCELSDHGLDQSMRSSSGVALHNFPICLYSASSVAVN